MNDANSLDPATLIASNEHRLTLQASLEPVADVDRFQPAGFPEIGHVIYDSPRLAADNRPEKVCIVDSAASMANHLETVCLDGSFGSGLAPELAGLPYVECVTDNGAAGGYRVVVTTFSEGHRLASSLFTDERSRLCANGQPGTENLGRKLLSEFGLVDLGKRSHPLPQDWWKVFKTIFKYDPNSLVHGILFPAMGIKIPRLLTAHLEAFGAARVVSAGVKFDKLLMTTSGQPIFAVDEETAREIRATFVIDLALLRSFGRTEEKDGEAVVRGLNEAEKQLLLALALWKVGRLLRQPFRFRSRCDLQLRTLHRRDGGADGELKIQSLGIDICAKIRAAYFQNSDKIVSQVTQVYWPANEIFKKAKEKAEAADDIQTVGDESDEQGAERTEE